MRVTLKGRERNLSGALWHSGWSSRVLMFKPRGVFWDYLQGSAGVSDNSQMQRDLRGGTAASHLEN